MDKIKVLHILRSPAGGIRRHVLGVAKYSAETCENFLATDESEADLRYQKSKSEGSLGFCDLCLLKIPSAPHPRDLINLIAIARFALKHDIALFHGHGAKGGLYARILGFLLGRPSVYTAHGGSLHTMFSPLMNFFYRYVEKFLYLISDAIVFESEYSLNQYKKRIKEKSVKFHLNYNGITFPDSAPTYREVKAPFIIGAFGLLRSIKGHDLLIKSLVRLNKDVLLHIHGSGEQKEELLALAKTLGVEDRVFIFESTFDVEAEMNKCSIVAQPSRFESFGYVPLEAMVLGVPVVVSNVGGLVEVVKDKETGLVFESENIEALTQVISNLLSDEFLRQRLVLRAWEVGQIKFSEKKMVDVLCKLYQSLMTKK